MLRHLAGVIPVNSLNTRVWWLCDANPMPVAKAAVLALAEITSATEAFDNGETNVFDALDAIAVAVEAYRKAVAKRRQAA